ncbi:MAG: hypothetical protein KJ674_05030 [Nanoarchaeota archaeon]|nr:hypothetical protein [Nanoarchaeota archaeon]
MDTKLIVTIIFGVVFIIATVFALVNAGKLLSEGFKELLGYEECYDNYPRVVELGNESEITKDPYCVDNRKRNIAEGLAYLIISLPIAIFFYRKFRKSMD